MVRLISLRRKTLPGIITEQSKVQKADNRLELFQGHFCRFCKWHIAVKHLVTFSFEILASCLLESNSMPANDNTWEGPSVFAAYKAAMLQSAEFICLRFAYREAFWDELSRLI